MNENMSKIQSEYMCKSLYKVAISDFFYVWYVRATVHMSAKCYPISSFTLVGIRCTCLSSQKWEAVQVMFLCWAGRENSEMDYWKFSSSA